MIRRRELFWKRVVFLYSIFPRTLGDRQKAIEADLLLCLLEWGQGPTSRLSQENYRDLTEVRRLRTYPIAIDEQNLEWFG
jgi:hypothetical protein